MGSHVVLSAEKAKGLAEKKLEAIQKKRAEALARHTADLIEKANRSWLRRLLHLKPMTEAKIREKEWDRPLYASILQRIEYLWFMEEDRLAKRILVAVQLGDPVHLSLEDAQILHDL